MGQVFRAIHLPSRQAVAVKVFRRGRTTRDSEEQQRRTESDTLRKLRHKNIVRLFDLHAGDGEGFLVMELVEGQNFVELVRQDGPLPAEIACELICQAAMALQHMHDRGLIHRDVKPDNLMLGNEGVVKIIDVGLALWGRTKVQQASPFLAGTLDYMAPEQFRASDQIDARADIYSLGCTLYYLLTGRRFLRCTRLATGKRHVNRGLPLEHAALNTPKWLVRLFNKMVAERPADRPASMGLIAAQLPTLDDTEEAINDSATQEDADLSPLPYIEPARHPSTASAAA